MGGSREGHGYGQGTEGLNRASACVETHVGVGGWVDSMVGHVDVPLRMTEDKASGVTARPADTQLRATLLA